uniref:Fibronectin type-III domain-containing protein n=1 Tax=Branchiostoma floridae TaxID=7739 RepID=C3YT10_BRAFL|eukprot:XP_002600566.1 hypothetical protein BRAFLDRAFT_70056 [Branchiostoma floridae]
MAAALRQVFAVTLLLQVISTETTAPPHITICTCDLDARTVTCSWERGPSDGNETSYTLTYWEDSFSGVGPVQECTDRDPSSCTFTPASLYVPYKVVLTRSEGDTGQAEPEDAGRQKAFTLRGLRPGTEYLIRIRCKAEYWGEYGSPVYVWTWQEAPEGVPTEVEAKTAPVNGTDGLKDVTFSWAEVPLEHQNGPIIRYHLNLTTGGKAISSASVDGNTTGYTFRNLAVNQAYQVVLWAVNAAGASPTVTYDIPGKRKAQIHYLLTD